MAALRAENAQLIEQRECEDRLLQQEIARRDEILEQVRWMERRRQLLRENRILMEIVAEQDRILEEMADRTRKIEKATAARREELCLLRDKRANGS